MQSHTRKRIHYLHENDRIPVHYTLQIQHGAPEANEQAIKHSLFLRSVLARDLGNSFLSIIRNIDLEKAPKRIPDTTDNPRTGTL